MKRIAFLALAIMFACCSCNSQRRAARRIQRITERHPELVAVQPHAIDTLIVLPEVQDSAAFPIVPLLMGDTINIPTAKGSFTIRMPEKRLDSIAVSYHAEQSPIRFTDTIRYAQVIINDEHHSAEREQNARHSRAGGNLIVLATISIAAAAIFLIRKKRS